MSKDVLPLVSMCRDTHNVCGIFFYVFESKEMKQMNRNHPDKVRFFFSFSKDDDV